MDLEPLVSQLLDPAGSVETSSLQRLCIEVRQGETKTIDVVQGLDRVLTNADHQIRLKGVQVLATIIVALPEDSLLEKEIEVLSEFLCQRVVDHESMAIHALKCLMYFLNCPNKPHQYNRTLIEFLKTKVNLSKLSNNNRLIVYEILRKVVAEKRKLSSNIGADLIYSLIHLIEGESNPQNLLTCFGIVSFVMKNFQDIEPFIDDLFEWLSSYYPIDYTPDESNLATSVKVSRADLVDALYTCFLATQLNAANLQTLLLEKLDSNNLSTKLESISLLIKCYQQFDLKCIHEYASTVWTSVRMECLKKLNMINPQLLEASYRLITALTSKLAEDDERYFTFISDMYEELAIAFRKPEMDLFEPAACLIAHAVEPKTKGFNYVLSQVLPVAIAAIKTGELRPIPGVVYLLRLLHQKQPGAKLVPEVHSHLNMLVAMLGDSDSLSFTSINLLKAIIQVRADLTSEVLDKIIAKLSSKPLTDDQEECLALVADKYNRTDIVSSDESSEKFSIYLSLLILKFRDYSELQLKKEDTKELLKKSRACAIATRDASVINKVGLLHAIIINKLSRPELESLIMDLFGSSFCKDLIPSAQPRGKDSHTYLPILQQTLKSLVLRNDQFSLPLINLLLNFITSDQVDEELALIASQAFKFVVMNDSLFDPGHNFKVFALHRQKFYSVSKKEISLRCQKAENSSKKSVLVCALAFQIPYLPAAAYKRDMDWLVREVLTVLRDHAKLKCNENMIEVLYLCMESFMGKETHEDLVKFLDSIVNLSLSYAIEGSIRVRIRALSNLYCVAKSFKDSQLLNMRSSVVSKLKPCLADRKRLVRQVAGKARLKWILVGQPIGQ